MDWKKRLKKSGMAALAALFLAMPMASAAEEAEGEPGAAQQEQMTPEEALQAYTDSGYKYTSQRYGYSIVCPVKPSVVPASLLLDEKVRGDVLVFKKSGESLNYAWVVLVDAFDEETIPPDITKQPEDKQKAFIDKIMQGLEYEFVRLTEVDGRAGIYAVQAKEMEVDTNGDGKYDEVLKRDLQMVKTFFRGAYGGRFGIMLLEDPELTQNGNALYQFGVLTFQEWPTKMENGANTSKQNKDKKEKKNKKEKKDKK